jgi:hypothetical protein
MLHLQLLTLKMKQVLVLVGYLYLSLLPAIRAQGNNNGKNRTHAVKLVGRSIGSFDINMSSQEKSETTILLRELLGVTVNFLDDQLYKHFGQDFQKISCSIKSYKIGDVKKDGATYTALVSITGMAFFLETADIDPREVSSFATSILETYPDSYSDALTDSQDPFLQALTKIQVQTNGNTVSSTDVNSDDDEPLMESWMIALTAGVGAFLLVMCACLIFICCMPVDDDISEYNDNKPKDVVQRVVTKTTGASSYNLDDDETDHYPEVGNSPSEIRSITSQDSSAFTYNPHSTKSLNSRASMGSYFTNSTAMEMDIAAWQAGSFIKDPQHQPFGHDISAIEKKKDLSLIAEEMEEENMSPAPAVRAKSRLTIAAVQDWERQHERSTSNSNLRTTGSAQEMIDDLEHLSSQIDRHRSR